MDMFDAWCIQNNEPLTDTVDGDEVLRPATLPPVLVKVPSSGLRTGDVVLTHGMRVLLDGPVKLSACHGPAHGGVRYSAGIVTNYDEVVASDPAMAHYIGIDNLDRPAGAPRWSIQGNDLATWNVERPS